MTISRPVQQIHNPVKAPEHVQWACKLNRITKDRFAKFCEDNGYTMQDVVDAALLDYMDLHDRTNGGEAQHEDESDQHAHLGEEDGSPFFDRNGEPVAEVP